jgi:hypothetical protein
LIVNSYSPVRRRRQPLHWFPRVKRRQSTGVFWWFLASYFKAKASGKKFNPFGPPPTKHKSTRGKPKSSGNGGASGVQTGQTGVKSSKPAARPAPKSTGMYQPTYKTGEEDPVVDAEVEADDIVYGTIEPDDEDDEVYGVPLDENFEEPPGITDNYQWVE